jgi:hypothetical protein
MVNKRQSNDNHIIDASELNELIEQAKDENLITLSGEDILILKKEALSKILSADVLAYNRKGPRSTIKKQPSKPSKRLIGNRKLNVGARPKHIEVAEDARAHKSKELADMFCNELRVPKRKKETAREVIGAMKDETYLVFALSTPGLSRSFDSPRELIEEIKNITGLPEEKISLINRGLIRKELTVYINNGEHSLKLTKKGKEYLAQQIANAQQEVIGVKRETKAEA